MDAFVEDVLDLVYELAFRVRGAIRSRRRPLAVAAAVFSCIAVVAFAGLSGLLSRTLQPTVNSLAQGFEALSRTATATASPSITPLKLAATIAPSPSQSPSPAATPSHTLAPNFRTLTVDSRRSWQDTGIAVGANEIVQVKYVSGLWTEGIPPLHDAGHRDAKGSPVPGVTCILTICPLKGFPEGILIARVGSQIIPVWNEIAFQAQTDGRLELRMNDSDEGSQDNAGEISVEVSAQDQPKK